MATGEHFANYDVPLKIQRPNGVFHFSAIRSKTSLLLCYRLVSGRLALFSSMSMEEADDRMAASSKLVFSSRDGEEALALKDYESSRLMALAKTGLSLLGDKNHH